MARSDVKRKQRDCAPTFDGSEGLITPAQQVVDAFARSLWLVRYVRLCTVHISLKSRVGVIQSISTACSMLHFPHSHQSDMCMADTEV